MLTCKGGFEVDRPSGDPTARAERAKLVGDLYRVTQHVRYGGPPDHGPLSAWTSFRETLVTQAVDDLEAEHVDLPTTLRLVAEISWREGRLHADDPDDPADSYDPRVTPISVRSDRRP